MRGERRERQDMRDMEQGKNTERKWSVKTFRNAYVAAYTNTALARGWQRGRTNLEEEASNLRLRPRIRARRRTTAHLSNLINLCSIK